MFFLNVNVKMSGEFLVLMLDRVFWLLENNDIIILKLYIEIFNN